MLQSIGKALDLVPGTAEDGVSALWVTAGVWASNLQLDINESEGGESELDFDHLSDVVDETFPESEVATADSLSRVLVRTTTLIESVNWSDKEIYHGRLKKGESERLERRNREVKTLKRVLVDEMKSQVIIAAVSIRTSLFLEILKQLFQINRNIIPNDVKFDFHEILEIGSWEEFLDYSYAKFVNTQGWRGGLDSQLKFFSSVLDQPLRLDSKYIDICQETEHYRHTLVHGSKVNETLIRRLKTTDLKIGDTLEFSDKKLNQIFDANIRLFHQMSRAALTYLGVPGPLLQYVADPEIIDVEE